MKVSTKLKDFFVREREKEILKLRKEAKTKSLRDELTRLYFMNRLGLIETRN